MSRSTRIAAVLLSACAFAGLQVPQLTTGAAPIRVHSAVVSGHASAKASGSGGVLAPCKDGAFTSNKSRWTKTLRWSFRAVSTPNGLAKKVVSAALQRAVHNIVSGNNSCGLVDRIDATEHYAGRTSRPTNVKDDSSCGRPDGHNVVAFGKLRGVDMAVTCWWTRGGSTIEADIKLNKTDYRWVSRVRPGCLLAWSIEAVATHEFGHAFGLDHVGEAVHGNLTMSPLIAPCENVEATLGLGDVKGLRSKY